MNDPGGRFMRRALELARRGLGRVSPNPPVGAVAVRDGRIIGEGWHRGFGLEHAEADLIARAPPESLRGADLYVSLEPCSHTGKTPPCTEAIIRAGFARVVFAVEDANPLTAGRGAERLRSAGLDVRSGLCQTEARLLLAPFFSWITRKRPLVTAKWAMTADGRVATPAGDSHWITSEDARRRARALRAEFDAILIGAGTLERDDPRLTARTRGRPNPLRVVASRRAGLLLESALLRTLPEAPVLLATRAPRTPEESAAVDAVRAAGAQALLLPECADGIAPVALLAALAERGVTHLLIEGGPRMQAAYLAAGLVDRVQVWIAARLAGGMPARVPLEGAGVSRMADALSLTDVRSARVGGDLLVTGAVTSAGSGRCS